LSIDSFSSDELNYIAGIIFKPLGLEIKELISEKESQEYAAHSFTLENLNVIIRKTKITPAKTGQFVTIWKRNEQGITRPYHAKDKVDLILIATILDNNFGIFIFPRATLLKQKILSVDKIEGKRGIRVYPSWNRTINNQAKKTQLWQSEYFIDLTPDKDLDLKTIQKLLTLGKLPDKI